MPVVRVHAEGADEALFDLVFPRRTARVPGSDADNEDAECWDWEWDEVQIIRSTIEGVGLAPHDAGGVANWSSLLRPIVLPFLGRISEVGDTLSARVLNCVLHGSFDVVPFGRLNCPGDSHWVMNGIYLESRPNDERLSNDEQPRPPLEALDELPAETPVLQVPLSTANPGSGVIQLDRRERSVVYLLKAQATGWMSGRAGRGRG